MPRSKRRHALISGGSSGLGLALADLLAAQGVGLTLLARDADRLSDARIAIMMASPTARIRGRVCDVADPDAVEAAVAASETECGPVDLAIACAGAATPGRFETLGPDVFRAQMELNYFGALNLARSGLRRMRARGRGELLLIGSAAALIGLPGHAAYAPSKFALRGLAQALRAECRADGVHVAIAHPADMDTPGLEAERRTTPPELAAISALGGLVRPEAAAARILRGLDAGRAEIHPGLASWALARLAPPALPLVQAWLDRIADRAQAKG